MLFTYVYSSEERAVPEEQEELRLNFSQPPSHIFPSLCHNFSSPFHILSWIFQNLSYRSEYFRMRIYRFLFLVHHCRVPNLFPSLSTCVPAYPGRMCW